MRLAALVCVAAFTLLSVPACSKGAGSSAAPSDRLRIAIPISPTQLNPILAQNTVESFADGLDLQFPRHARPAAPADSRPCRDRAVADKWRYRQRRPDASRTTCATASNGKTAPRSTSRDVKFTWQAIMNPSNNVVSRRGYDQIASMDTPDDYTVVMHMKRIFPPAVDTLFAESDTPITRAPRAPSGKVSGSQSRLVQRGAGRNRSLRVRALAARRPHRAAREPVVLSRRAPIKDLTLAIIPDDNTTSRNFRRTRWDLGIEITRAVYRRHRRRTRRRSPARRSPTYTAIDLQLRASAAR